MSYSYLERCKQNQGRKTSGQGAMAQLVTRWFMGDGPMKFEDVPRTRDGPGARAAYLALKRQPTTDPMSPSLSRASSPAPGRNSPFHSSSKSPETTVLAIGNPSHSRRRGHTGGLRRPQAVARGRQPPSSLQASSVLPPIGLVSCNPEGVALSISTCSAPLVRQPKAKPKVNYPKLRRRRKAKPVSRKQTAPTPTREVKKVKKPATPEPTPSPPTPPRVRKRGFLSALQATIDCDDLQSTEQCLRMLESGNFADLGRLNIVSDEQRKIYGAMFAVSLYAATYAYGICRRWTLMARALLPWTTFGFTWGKTSLTRRF